MKKMHVKRGDTVKVIAGKDKGKEGKIITAIPADGKVIVEGVAVAKRHQKARVQGQESGIIHKEMPIDASNVMRVCSKCGKAARTRGIPCLKGPRACRCTLQDLHRAGR